MIPFVEGKSLNVYTDSFFHFIDDTLYAAALPELDLGFNEIFSPEELLELEASAEATAMHEAITGLDCFVSGCTEDCAKTHLSFDSIVQDIFDSDQFQIFPQDFIKTEPEEASAPSEYTPLWDHCYYLSSKVKEESKEQSDETTSEDSNSDSNDDDDDDSDDAEQCENDDYFVDVESLPPPITKRPVGRPRIKRDLESTPLQVNGNKGARKRGAPAQSNQRPAKVTKIITDASDCSDSDSEWSEEASQCKRRGGRKPKYSLESDDSESEFKYFGEDPTSKRRNAAGSVSIADTATTKKGGKRTTGRKSGSVNNQKHNSAEKVRRYMQRTHLNYLRTFLDIEKPNPAKVIVLNKAAETVMELRHTKAELKEAKKPILKKFSKLAARFRELALSMDLDMETPGRKAWVRVEEIERIKKEKARIEEEQRKEAEKKKLEAAKKEAEKLQINKKGKVKRQRAPRKQTARKRSTNNKRYSCTVF